MADAMENPIKRGPKQEEGTAQRPIEPTRMNESLVHMNGIWEIPGLPADTTVEVVKEGPNAIAILLNGKRWTGGELGGSHRS